MLLYRDKSSNKSTQLAVAILRINQGHVTSVKMAANNSGIHLQLT